MLLSILKLPFHPYQLEWKPLSKPFEKDGKGSAKMLAFIQLDEAVERLEKVVGLGNYQTNTQVIMPESNKGMGSVSYTISIKIDGEWVSRSDGAELSVDLNSNGIEGTFPVRAAMTDAFKRTANIGWGIGRYLRRPDKNVYGKFTKDGTRWNLDPNQSFNFTYDCPIDAQTFKDEIANRKLDFDKTWKWLLDISLEYNAYIPPQGAAGRAYDIYLGVIDDAIKQGYIEV